MSVPSRPEICQAIRNKSRIHFMYNTKLRVGEPQCYGVNLKGNEAVRVCLVNGEVHPERLFLTEGIRSLKVLDEHFNKPGPNYKIDDKDMKVIFCQL